MNSVLTSTPKLFVGNKGSGYWRFGSLSSESVCSENLKPWKKLLPCKIVSYLFFFKYFVMHYLAWLGITTRTKKFTIVRFSFNFTRC